MVRVAIAVHPFASVTVRVYVPGSRFWRLPVVSPLLQANVYGEVPPETEEEIVAFCCPVEIGFYFPERVKNGCFPIAFEVIGGKRYNQRHR